MSRDVIMPEVITEFVELVEDDHIVASLAKFPCLVEDLLHVRLAARRGNNLTSYFFQPFEALPAHTLW